MNAMLLRPALDPGTLLLGRLVPAGFPSPADDYLESEIDLNRYLIERPAACYLMRVSRAWPGDPAAILQTLPAHYP